MPARRPLGRILVDDFDWDADEVDRVAAARNTAADGPRIGAHFRRYAEPNRAYEVALALLIQRSERPSRTEAAQFARDEYRELGLLYRFDRKDMDNKVRTYSALVLTMVLYIAYPLNVIFTATNQNRVLPDGVLILYASVGLFLIFSTLWLGDYTVKKYGAFIKRRVRLSRSRAILRAYFVASDPSLLTAMPTRRQEADERADPELTGFQLYLPLIYSAWCIIKLSLAVYFLALIWERKLEFSVRDLRGPSAVLLMAAPFWVQLAGSMCERYHKYIKEALAVSDQRPYPRASTEHLRRTGWWDRLASLATAYGLLIAVMLALGVFVIGHASNPAVDIGGRPVLLQEVGLGGMALVLVMHLVLRIVDVKGRVKQAIMMPPSPARPEEKAGPARLARRPQ